MVWKIKALVGAAIVITILFAIRKAIRDARQRRKMREDAQAMDAAHRMKCLKILRNLLEHAPVQSVMTDPHWYLLRYGNGHIHYKRSKDMQTIVLRHPEGDLTLCLL